MEDSEVTAWEWPSAEEKAENVAQAIALREQARLGGLRFDAYLPPGLADWLLGLVETGTFLDPSEAVFVLLQQQRELEPHQDLRRALRNRTLQAAMDDPRPTIPAQEVFRQLREERTSSPDPAMWRNRLANGA